MRIFSVDLWNDGESDKLYSGAGGRSDGFRPTLDGYVLASAAPRPAVLVLPGSGYFQCSPREAEALAVRFNAAGWHAFVLWYSCAPRRHPAPLLDCARAFTVIRRRAAEWDLDPGRLALLGFSAGGHLALTEALYYDRDFAAAPGVDPALGRPDALVLCYPVVTSGEAAHRGSFDMLLGERPDPALLDLLSLERHVAEAPPPGLPPVFLWHTWADQSVPVENSLLLAAALRRTGTPLEMHLFPEGKHGISLATSETAAGDPAHINPHTAQWFDLCVRWLRERFGG